MAIGSRWLQSELQIQRQPVYRQLLGRIFNLALRLVLGLRFKDTQWGFKAFTRSTGQRCSRYKRSSVGDSIPSCCTSPENSAQRVEVPVAWSHREGTRINPSHDGIRMFGEVLRICWNALSGKYSTKPPVSEVL